MISLRRVTKRFGTQEVLSDASFQVNPGERVSIVGPNGAGKSTVFNLIVGEISPDKGEVVAPSSARIGYVHQQLNAHGVSATLLEYVENAVTELQGIQAEMHALESRHGQAGAGGPDPSALRRLGELQTRFEHLDGYRLKNRAERTLSGLGFPAETFHAPFRELSGGWQSRAELARALVAEPEILLLDEPSNYLDIPAIEWLKGYLDEFRGTLALISHDRFLLNSLTRVTVEVAGGRAERYPGNYDYYVRERGLRHRQRLAERKNQERKREQIERFIERFRAKNTKAAQAQSRVKQLAKMKEIELPRVVEAPGRIRLRPPQRCGAEVARLEGAGVTYDGSRWVLRGIDLRIMRGEKIALVGYNGYGKTTLLRMLAGNLPLSEGKRVLGHKVAIGYQSQDFAETMDPGRTVFDTVKSAASDSTELEVRTLLGGFGFPGDSIEKTVGVLSGGEKIRLAFARLLLNPPNFLILDEPTTHLDIQSCEALERALESYQGTICLVSHDIDFVRRVAGGIIAMTPPGITRYAGGYDYYREKVSPAVETGGPAVAAAGAAPAVAASAQTADRKELRRQRALLRQRRHERSRDLKKDVQRIERQIDVYEKERDAILLQLSGDPSTVDFGGLSARLGFIEDELRRYADRWEQAALAVERAVSGEDSAAPGQGDE